jgi:glyoxylase-like metal-dependent hydrolase (beta-lactamase superfamily II)
MRVTAIQFSRALLAVLGVLALLSVSPKARGGQGGAAPAAAPAAPDFSKVEIKTTKVGNNLYTLEGQGGMIGVLVGPDGVFLVDTQFAPLTPKIVAAVKQLSPLPIKFVVNTHVHGDHTGGNENLAKMGATIFSRDELRAGLANPPAAANGTPGVPAPPAALPMVTYRGPVTFHMNGETVELTPIPRAHTDGDTLVQFVNADVIMTGDFYRSVGFPNIDRINGGSLNGMVAGLGVVIGKAGPNTKIIPGHGPTVDRTAVMAHRDMILALRDKVQQLVAQGKSQDEVLASHPTMSYDAQIPQAATTNERFVGQLYAELKPRK